MFEARIRWASEGELNYATPGAPHSRKAHAITKIAEREFEAFK
jgi:hypothetical protein